MPRDVPPSSAGPPEPEARPPNPPPYDTAEGRAPPLVRERAGATSAGGGLLPRSPLTANRSAEPPPPALAIPPPPPSQPAPRAGGEQSWGPERGGLAPKGWRAAGEECAPPVDGWPSGTGTTRPPPATAGGWRQGNRGGLPGTPPPPPPFPPPPPPRPADGRRPAREAADAHPPRQGRGAQGGYASAAASAAVGPVPPIGCPPTPGVPADNRQLCIGTQGRPVGRSGTATPRSAAWRAGHRRSDPPWCPPGGAGKQTAARRPPRSPPWGYGALRTPPPPRQTDPPTAGQAAPGAGSAWQPRLNIYTQGGCAGEEGGLGREPRASPQGRRVGNHGATPPPLFPPLPPPVGGPRGRRPPTPTESEGTSPLPPKGPRRPGGDAAEPSRRAPPRPPPPASAGAATGRRTRPSAQGRHTDQARGRHANTNQSIIRATPSMT